MKYFRIIEWANYQHYKDRDPPWIKLHRDLLTSRTWVSLDNDGRVLAVACMLVAAGTENKIPADPAYFQRRAYLSSEPDFAPLVACGFIEDVNEIKDFPEKREQSSPPRKHMLASGTECSSESESEERRDSESSPPATTVISARKARAELRGMRLPDDWQPSEEDRAFASSNGLKADDVAAEFRDFWQAVPGAKGRKLDWSATFRNRCREIGRRSSPPKPPAKLVLQV